MIFTYWLELTKLRTDERNVGEAFLYLSFKIVLSKKSEEIYYNHVYSALQCDRSTWEEADDCDED